jgi:PKD domain
MSRSAARSRPAWRRCVVVATTALVAVGGVEAFATAAPASPVPSTRTGTARLGTPASHTATPDLTAPGTVPGVASGTVHYAKSVPLCKRAKPREVQCFAVKRVDVPAGTKGAYRYVVPSRRPSGPAGGYTPHDLATAYRFHPNVHRSHQTVAIVDWYDNRHARADLDKFDRRYGLPHENRTSFRKVNQYGRAAPLPRSSRSTSTEIALDIEAVRAVCHTCRILLLEARRPKDADLAVAENTAVRMGADEISNSYGEPEHRISRRIVNAYNHPGVVITASTGDDGWFGWDFANDAGGASQNAASFPSTSPTVVAVGGTELALNKKGGRAAEVVWNENGPKDQYANGRMGATGGGCSRIYAARPWQRTHRGYRAAGCNGHRLTADVSAIADPQLGFDIYDSIGSGGWVTIGGTSLSSPVTAALFALAGGAHGAAYPAASLYVNSVAHRATLKDVVAYPDPSVPSGSGFCGGTAARSCGVYVYRNTTHQTHNPNSLGFGLLDCSFPRNRSRRNVQHTSSECNTVRGYDGPTGLGAPESLALYRATNPSAQIALPHRVRAHVLQRYAARVRRQVTPDRIVGYTWQWGDGTRTHRASRFTHHTYRRGGTFHANLRVFDSRHQTTVKRFTVRVLRTSH